MAYEARIPPIRPNAIPTVVQSKTYESLWKLCSPSPGKTGALELNPFPGNFDISQNVARSVLVVVGEVGQNQRPTIVRTMAVVSRADRTGYVDIVFWTMTLILTRDILRG